MPAAEYLRAPIPAAASISRSAAASIGRSTAASISRTIFSLRKDQNQMNSDKEKDKDKDGHSHSHGHGHHAHTFSEDDAAAMAEFDAFQNHIADILKDLSSANDEELLSLPWLHKLLDMFLLSIEEFRVMIFNHRSVASRPPADKLVGEFCDRAVKALDVCNAVRDGIDQLRRCRRHLDIIPAAISSSSGLGEGQLRRARKALADLTILMVSEERDFGAGLIHRNRSFGKNRAASSSGGGGGGGHHRSLSWSVSRSWSAGKQIHAIASNISTPKEKEATGMAAPVYTMNAILLFTMWAVVAAVPCQDRRGGVAAGAHFAPPRSYVWAAPLMAMQDRIVEESKKKEKKNSICLMREVDRIERCTGRLLELIDAGVGTTSAAEEAAMAAAEEKELRWRATEIAQIGEGMKEELDSLEQQIREVFVTIVRGRTDGFDCGANVDEA